MISFVISFVRFPTSFAGFSWVLLLNDDAFLEPGAYEAMQSAIAPTVGVIGPVIYHQNKVQSAGIEVHKWGRIRNIQEHPQTSIVVDALCGACKTLKLLNKVVVTSIFLILNPSRFSDAFRAIPRGL